MNLLILETGPQPYLKEAIKKEGHTSQSYKPSDMYLYVSGKMNGYDRIYDGNSDLEEPSRMNVKGYDAGISRIGSSLSFGSIILQHLTDNLGIYFPQSPNGLMIAQDKMKTMMYLSKYGIQVPMTVFARNASHVEHLIKMLGGLPVIAKVLKGSQGLGVMICRDPEQTNTTLESFWNQNIDIMLQRFIDAESKDVRAIVVGDRVVVAMQRTGIKDFRANISRGGSGKKIELTKEQETLCVKAAKAIGLEFAGVDLMTDKEGKNYIIEVNGNPGTKIIKITGHNYFIDLVRYIDTKVKRIKLNPKADILDKAAISQELALMEMQSRRTAGLLDHNQIATLSFLESKG
jgi:ribosomal protein S6--L-glutamate ligase